MDCPIFLKFDEKTLLSLGQSLFSSEKLFLKKIDKLNCLYKSSSV
jgi:hypothetical protein